MNFIYVYICIDEIITYEAKHSKLVIIMLEIYSSEINNSVLPLSVKWLGLSSIVICRKYSDFIAEKKGIFAFFIDSIVLIQLS